MSLLQISTTYDSYKNIWQTHEARRSPISAGIDASFYQADSSGFKTVPPGTWFGTIPGSILVRPLPRARLAALSATGTAVITVVDARLFKVGDVLTALSSLAFSTFAGTWANADTATWLLGNSLSVTHTVSGFTTLTALATAAAVTLNANALFTRDYVAIASGVIVYFYPKNFTFTPLFSTSAVAAGGGTNAASGASFTPGLSLGTITAAGINTTTNVITFTANSARVLPIGFPIGVITSLILGLIDEPVDLIRGDYQDVGLFTGGSVTELALPYVDTEIKNNPNFTFTYV